ncbi:MAG: hypothetical protein AAF152_01735 [Cyanobacteria bacterium P01_A01_bin.114]
MPASFISKSLYVCNCGPDCKCGYSASKPSSCGCGAATVKRHVLAEDIDSFYVSQTGEAGEDFDVLGNQPFTSPDGKPLQRFPKDKYVTSVADRMSELKTRAQQGIGNLSQKISPNYQRDDVQSPGHGHSNNMSVRRAEHKGKEIVIKTYYEITIDGKLFENHLMVDDRGRVHCHGLPNYAYPSMIDLIKRLIDAELEQHPGGDTADPSHSDSSHSDPSHQGGHH